MLPQAVGRSEVTAVGNPFERVYPYSERPLCPAAERNVRQPRRRHYGSPGMTELTEREVKQLTGALRPNRKPLWIGVGANVLMAGLLLGVPYVRGRMLAQNERADFVAFARCMIGGDTVDNPGLSLPRGEREHYASKVLYANADWPLSCRPTLRRLQPPDATFLWPSVKTAGADLRAAVELVDRELVALARRRTQAPGRVPQRPLDAIKRLQAASVLFARAADVSRHADNDALVLEPEVRALAAPARLPMMLGESQGLLAWSDAGTLQVLGLDGHSLGYLRVEAGKLDRQRIRKTNFLRGFARAGETPYLVWAMPDARCAEREDGCVGRPTGFSRFDKGSAQLGEPTWRVQGHPAERLDRSLVITEIGRVDLLAKSSLDGGIELLRARLPLDQPGGGAEARPTWLEPEVINIVPPLAAAPVRTPPSDKDGKSGASTWAAAAAAQADGVAKPQVAPPAASDASAAKGGSAQETSPPRHSSAILLEGEPLAVLRAVDTAGKVDAALVLAGQTVQTRPLPSAAGSGGWVSACSSGEARWLAYGSSSELHLARVEAADVQPLMAASLELGQPLDAADASRDRLRLVCTDQLLRVLFVDRKEALNQITCSRTDCGQPSQLAPVVRQFSALQRQDVSVISFNEGPLAPTIKLLRLDAQGRAFGPPSVAGACWEPLGGLCGTSYLTGDAQRIALMTRDGPDLLVLESTNTGRSWSTLSGFAQRPALGRSSASPMQQHRIRKGLDE